MRTVSLLDGKSVPALGQGTWRMGESERAHNDEVAALKLGIELGMTLIDTAEMYGDGRAEEVVADATAGQRNRLFIVTKVYPHNASRAGLPQACERSLKRLRTDVVDLYLLHWREKRTPLDETIEAFEKLKAQGKIRYWGVSNFDLKDMKELFAIRGGTNCATNQVLYNLEHRGIEFELVPWCQKNKIPIMAYSPIGHGRGFLSNSMLKNVRARRNRTPAQIAIAWLLGQPNTIVIPKASNPGHVRENAAANEIQLTKEDLAELDRAFPPAHSSHLLAIR